MTARQLALTAFLANLVLLLAWYGLIAPIPGLSKPLVLAVLLVPALPALLTLALQRLSASFWAALAALIYFSHGIMEFWTDPALRALAGIESGLSLSVIVSASWQGLRARFGRSA
jgi:uncharacterized membrane protein